MLYLLALFPSSLALFIVWIILEGRAGGPEQRAKREPVTAPQRRRGILEHPMNGARAVQR